MNYLRTSPFTIQAEQSAPYTALAETAGSRLAQARELEQEQEQIETQKSQFSENLAFQKEQADKANLLEQDRLAELKRQSEESLALQRSQYQSQLDAAAAAREEDKKARTMETVGLGITGFAALGEWGGSIASGIGKALSFIGGKTGWW